MTKRRVLLGLGAGVFVITGAAYGIAAYAQQGSIPRSAFIGNADVSGMTVNQAQQEVAKKIVMPSLTPLSLRIGGKAFALEPHSAGLEVDVAQSVAQLTSRSWNPVAVFNKYFRTSRVEVKTAINDNLLKSALESLSTIATTSPVEPSIRFTDGAAVVTNGTSGQSIDIAKAVVAIHGHFAKSDSPLTLPIINARPTVSNDAVTKFVPQAQAMLDRPMTISIGSKSATLSPAMLKLGSMFVGKNGQMELVIDGKPLVDDINKQLPALGQPAKDATFKIWHGKPYVVPAVVGRGVTAEEVSQYLTPAIIKGESNRVAIPLAETNPQLTTEAAKKLGVVEKLGSFTQHFPYAPYRVQNIGQASRYMNGTLIMPGGTYSMNDTVKERTAANGYTIGFVIGAGGQFKHDYGGGVSTATTAMWTAAFYSNMERVEQRAHSFWISRYTPGLEATVSWGSLDLKWRNPNSTAVFITSYITDTSVTVTLWGTKTYDRVEAVSSPRRNVRPFTTVISTDEGCVDQEGVQGFDITVTRNVYAGGKLAKSEPMVTNYSAAPTVICRAKPSP